MIYGEVTYTVLKPSDFVPREEMRLDPKSELPQTRLMDLNHLRNGVPVLFVIGDSYESMRAAATYSCYYQQVAYLEGWTFDPKKYRILTAPVGSIPVDGEGRVLDFSTLPESIRPAEASRNGRIGFRVQNDSIVDRMTPCEADFAVDFVEHVQRRVNSAPKVPKVAHRLF
jgi:hypothetical protein